MLLYLDDDLPDPHPEWVKTQPVTSADLMAAGLFPREPWFTPAVPAR